MTTITTIQASHGRRQPARGTAALRRDRRRRHGVCRLGRLPLPRVCKTNDIVLAHSLNTTGTSWSAVTRVPIDATSSGIDHFIPGLAVNKATSGGTAQLGLTYYFYPSGSTQLSVGFISSTNAGSTWSTPQTVASGMPSTWAATTSQGRMVGDYISTSYGSDNLAHGIFATAHPADQRHQLHHQRAGQLPEPISTFYAGLRSGSVSRDERPGALRRQRRWERRQPLERRGQQRQQAPRLTPPLLSLGVIGPHAEREQGATRRIRGAPGASLKRPSAWAAKPSAKTCSRTSPNECPAACRAGDLSG